MAVGIHWKRISDDAEITATASSPYNLSPYTLYRGMAAYVEYHYMYVINTGGSAMVNPSYTLYQLDAAAAGAVSYAGRKVTVRATGTVLLDYKTAYWDTSVGVRVGPSAMEASMAVNRSYDIYTEYKAQAAETVKTFRWRHHLGGHTGS